MTNFPLRIDVKAAQMNRDWDNIRNYALDTDAEETFGGFWMFDHFVPLNMNLEGQSLDGWTLLAALGTITKRARLGLMVGCNGYRNPAVLAKIATTIDQVSGGRLDMGLGAGWFELEYKMYGIPFPPPAQRIRELDEACQMIKMLWTQDVSNFEGKYYTLSEARHEPKPIQRPYPPFVLGGGGEKLMLRVVAKHADMYNSNSRDPEEVKHKNEVLDEHCRAIGRDPGEIRRSVQVMLRGPEDATRVRELIEPFLAVGIDHVVVGMPNEYASGLVGQIAKEVAPLLG